MSSAPTFPFPGMKAWTNSHNAVCLRVHYSSDPTKGIGEKTFVPEVKEWLPPWALREFQNMTDPSLYRQEYEIDGSATQGALVFQLDEEATLEESFPIPETWTRYFALDPHPAVPHAALWGAVDPWGDLWIYREYWPSDVSYRYESGILKGKPGKCLDGEPPCYIRNFINAVRFFESPDNPQNKDDKGNYFSEDIYCRVIDYAARAFGKGTQDDDPTDNYQVRFEKHMSGKCNCQPQCERISCPSFEDAKKNRGVGEENVNDWLKPRMVDVGKEKWEKGSRLHIFKDRCPELIYQLKNNRRQQLTPIQAEKIDPTGKPVEVRKHMTDNLLYMCAANPKYRTVERPANTFTPMREGFSY